MANRGVPSGKPGATDRARTLRSDLSVPERVLWKHLRARRLAGLKFRRQHPIGPYDADFCCTEASLIDVLEMIARVAKERMAEGRASEAE